MPQGFGRSKIPAAFLIPANRSKPGLKGPCPDLIAAIVALKSRNPRFGCVRIAQELADAFGIELNKDVVRRVLEKNYKSNGRGSDGPSWLTFIAHTKDSLWSVDLFRCESILVRSHWVMVVMDVFTRRIIGFGVEGGALDGVAVCRMFNAAVSGQPTPRHISTDHDPLFRFHRWRANLLSREIDEIKSVPYVPTSHSFVERLIGTARREYLDRMFFWNSVNLTRKLAAFRDYYNAHRVHRSLDGTAPDHRAGLSTRSVRRSNITLGDIIAADCFRRRWRRDCEFATHTRRIWKKPLLFAKRSVRES
jgi:putative transposase